MKNNKKKGFTLVELIIVIVIIGILAAVLIPQITSYIKKAKISKGVQNARNVSTFVMSELILNDKDTYFPNEVVKLCMDNGYNLKSELDDYAYWYDTENNIIVYKSIEEECNPVSADETVGLENTRVEGISKAHPKYYYVDQQSNNIKKAIDTVNNLVEYAMAENTATGSSYKMGVITKMGEILQSAVNSVKSMKLSGVSYIADYISTFTPLVGRDAHGDPIFTEDGSGHKTYTIANTIYYSDFGVFNEAVELLSGKTGAVNATHAVINDNTQTIVTDLVYESISFNIDEPLLITPTVKSIDDYTVKTLVSGVFYCSANTSYNSSLLHGSAQIKGLETLSNIKYTLFEMTPKYTMKEYRFTNGLLLNVSLTNIVPDTKVVEGQQINYDRVELVERELVIKKYTRTVGELIESIYLPLVKEGSELSFYNPSNKANTYYNLAGEYKVYDEEFNISPSTGEIVDFESNAELGTGDYSCKFLSMYLIPSIFVTNDDISFEDFVTISGVSGSITGNISVRLTNDISSVKYTAVLVDNNLNGYLIDNVGYITNIGLSINQTTTDYIYKDNGSEVEKTQLGEGSGKQTAYNNDKAVINVELPDDAKAFSNYRDCKVEVSYQYQFTEYTRFELADGTERYIYVQNGYKTVLSDVVTKQLTATANGFQLVVDDLDSFEAKDSGNNTVKCNQIKVSKVKVYAEDGVTVLFERYYY